ncbi:hypothetical protein K502DRAFT_362737 [Neoconidiobolus thromboides FSU 785]|nr:hypothetical protein K502DRAFT_362737 [Neoconidiobolus thromboides FSU 785]
MDKYKMVHYAKEYNPIKSCTVDGQGRILNDKGCIKALNKRYDCKKINQPTQDPYRTLFVARLKETVVESELESIFKKFGTIENIKLIRNIITGESKRYCFIQFSTYDECKRAYQEAKKYKIQGKKILVDYERDRIMKNWKPRRLGGGLGGQKESGQLRFGGRDKPFKPPYQRSIYQMMDIPKELCREDCWRYNNKSYFNNKDKIIDVENREREGFEESKSYRDNLMKLVILRKSSIIRNKIDIVFDEDSSFFEIIFLLQFKMLTNWCKNSTVSIYCYQLRYYQTFNFIYFNQETKSLKKAIAIQHLQPNLSARLSFQQFQHLKVINNASIKRSSVSEDPRLYSVSLFLPTIYEDPEYLTWEIKNNYRQLLKQANKFLDNRVKIRTEFRKYQSYPVNQLIKTKRAKTRKHLRKLIKANNLDPDSLLTVLENAYGRRGNLRWELLKDYLFKKSETNNIDEIDSINDIDLKNNLLPQLLANPKFQHLLLYQGYKLKPSVPESIQHSSIRVNNYIINYYKRLFFKLLPPLSSDLIKELENKAQLNYYTELMESQGLKPNYEKLRKLARAYQKLLLKCSYVDKGGSEFKLLTSLYAGKKALPCLNGIDLLGLK